MRSSRREAVKTHGEQETRALGRRLAADLRPGDRIGVSGPLGAGKTVLARGLCEGLGVDPADVSSPTFAIVNTYEGRVSVFHVDLYRVSSIEEIEATGLLDLFEEGVVVVEWIDRVPEIFDDGGCRIVIEDLGGDGRRITIDRDRGD